ncbi:MAG: amidophosphoribosyltransferase [Spirochaetaceae bacterium]|nr:amidophosphoribosyltransferase [Spirochaetaceae bacterium]
MTEDRFDAIEMKEACGIVGIAGAEASRLAFYGLFALQHRGQESAGIAASDGISLRLHKDTGLVSQVFRDRDLDQLAGNFAIGHTRYSTTGGSTARNAQPFLIDTRYGPLALGHNGNIANAPALRKMLLEKGIGLMTGSDSELLAMMLAGSEGENWPARIASVMHQWVGAYSLVLLTKDGVYGVRDPWGFRPLAWGELSDGGYALASETCALQLLGCREIGEVPRGAIVRLDGATLTMFDGWSMASQGNPETRSQPQQASCSFEYVYFSRPDSVWNGKSVHAVRRAMGEILAEEAPADADVVIAVPDSSIAAAIGYAHRSGIPYDEGLVKNRYIGRTFIEPTQSLRKKGVALKFATLPGTLQGARIVVVDDSIVRGTTTKPLVALLRAAGASEVHLRIASPPVLHQCYMGVDMGEQLIAVGRTVDEIARELGADSLAYLSVDGLARAIGVQGLCRACFDGNYPIPVDEGFEKSSFEGGIR